MSTWPDPQLQGYQAAPVGGEFASRNGPFYARWHEERFELAFRVEARHVNPGNTCHGGMLSLFADILISTAAKYQADLGRQFLPTISLQQDFLAAAPLGSWVTGKADILKVTKNLVFSQGLIWADGVTVLRASGVFRRGPVLTDSPRDGLMQLPGMSP
jgi:uncharacterized protein (TIGR00369 family)